MLLPHRPSAPWVPLGDKYWNIEIFLFCWMALAQFILEILHNPVERYILPSTKESLPLLGDCPAQKDCESLE